MQTVRITTTQNIDIDYDVAGLGERIPAYLIDALIFVLCSLYLIFLNVRYELHKNEILFFIIWGVFGLIYLLYDLACETFFNGQTIGKRVMKIRVISLDGGRPSIGQFLLRWLFRIVDLTITSGIGAIISVAASEKKQRIGDLVAGTTLIRTIPRTTIQQVAFITPGADYEIVFNEAANLTDQEISLLHEVLINFRKSDNFSLLHNAAAKIKKHLNISDSKKLTDEQFLQTIIKDYNQSQAYID